MPPKKRAGTSAGGSGPGKRATPEPYEPLAKVLQEEPPLNEVHETLKSTPDGLAVLSHYRRYGGLDHATRDTLSARVIYGELRDQVDIRLTVERLQDLAKQIKELFPTESDETWCLVETKRNKQVVTGRLKHKFYNIRRLFIKVGLISSRHLEEELNEDEGLDQAVDFDNDDDMLWLFNHSGPFLELNQKWTETAEKRILLRKSLSIYDYVNKFPCLRQQHGWEMLTVEWETANPSCKEAVRDQWPVFLKFLEQELLKDKVLKEVLKDCKTEGEKVIEILLNFCKLFKVRTLPKAKGASETWRPSRCEVQQAFFLHIKKIVELREIIESRKEVVSRFKYTLQPFVVIVGSRSNIDQILVILDNVQWVATSPLQALDICFKVFFALDGSYPAEARHLWLFIQRCVYKLELDVDYYNDRGLRAFLASHLTDFKTFCDKFQPDSE